MFTWKFKSFSSSHSWAFGSLSREPAGLTGYLRLFTFLPSLDEYHKPPELWKIRRTVTSQLHTSSLLLASSSLNSNSLSLTVGMSVSAPSTSNNTSVVSPLLSSNSIGVQLLPFTERDIHLLLTNHYQTVTASLAYSHLSVEELRLNDLRASGQWHMPSKCLEWRFAELGIVHNSTKYIPPVKRSGAGKTKVDAIDNRPMELSRTGQRLTAHQHRKTKESNSHVEIGLKAPSECPNLSAIRGIRYIHCSMTQLEEIAVVDFTTAALLERSLPSLFANSNHWESLPIVIPSPFMPA
jgi:hypothetical protein